MVLDENKIKKVLTHDFVTGSSIQNFDDIIVQCITKEGE